MESFRWGPDIPWGKWQQNTVSNFPRENSPSAKMPHFPLLDATAIFLAQLHDRYIYIDPALALDQPASRAVTETWGRARMTLSQPNVIRLVSPYATTDGLTKAR
jgi:hypothetical protein